MEHTEFTFAAHDGLTLYAHAWLPDQPKAVVVLLHGFAEHCGRYEHLAGYLNERGYALEAYDHRGHGRSGGKQAHVLSFDAYVEDARLFGQQVRDRAKGRPVFLMGHSMGGTVATQLALADQSAWSGLVLSSPGLKLSSVPQWQQDLVKLVAVVAPALPTVKIDSKVISRDPEVVVAYDSDPLNYRGGARAGWSAAFAEAIDTVQARASELIMPFLVMVGEDDHLIDPAGSVALHKASSSSDKTLLSYSGGYHELLNDLDKDQVMADIVSWLEAHL